MPGTSGELFKSGKRVRLQQQPFDVLRTLITRPGEVVTRDDLRKALWPDDVTVDFDQSLNKSVTKLRDAVGDLATSPRFIETLPKRGYRFIADVHSAESADSTVAAESEQRPVNHRLRWISGGVWLSATAAAAMVVTIAALAITATRNSANPLEAGAEKSRGVDSAATHTPIFAARDAYDLGRAALTRRSEESLKLSLQHFTRAVALSPRFAAAHVGLAESWALLASLPRSATSCTWRGATTRRPPNSRGRSQSIPTSRRLAAISPSCTFSMDAARQRSPSSGASPR
jgi:DNA-binding winged helix-turn-helix (wHTH) protein